MGTTLIAFVTYPGVTALDLVGPLEVLARLPDTESVLVSNGGHDVTTDTRALRLGPGRDLAEVSDPDVVLVPGGVEGTVAAMADPALLGWLAGAAASARWVTSVCTGAHVLGAAGLMQGRRATTHWAVLDELALHGAHPVSERWVVDGNVVTAAGVSAGLDMAFWLAAQLANEDTARRLQLFLEYDPRPPFDGGSPAAAGPEMVAAVRAAILPA